MRTTSDMQQAPALLAEAKTIVDKNPQTPALVRADSAYRAGTRRHVQRRDADARYAHEAAGLPANMDAASDQLADACASRRWPILSSATGPCVPSCRSARSQRRARTTSGRSTCADAQPWNWQTRTRGGLMFNAAERIYREILAESMRRNGELHVDTVHVEARLVGFLHATSRGKEAQRFARINTEQTRAQRGQDRRWPGRRWSTATPRISLFSEGQFGAADRLITEASDQARRFLPNSIVLASRLLPQGLLLTEIGHYAEAGPILDEAASVLKCAMGADAASGDLHSFPAGARPLADRVRACGAGNRLAAAAGFPARCPTAWCCRSTGYARRTCSHQRYVAAGQIDGAATAQSVLDQLERSAVRDYYQSIEADAAAAAGARSIRTGDPRAARADHRTQLEPADTSQSSSPIAESRSHCGVRGSAGAR